ncbi:MULTISPECIES: NAD(P)/FAD-dependent oxidoreductase [unclassified Nocardia]|uniref:FAD-dependent oxidoreductase n=1 Tax=unclassified Nocardia TaxID=2637762 RepID=UPI001CE43358|nr:MULTISPECIES: NAD(P)/FAD-dependent oxidoreductase [unclassified Nocardia]
MVTIVGGGIAGSVLAGALARRGEQVALYEQQSAGPGAGAFLFIDGRGHNALTTLGVSEAELYEASYPLVGLQYRNSAGFSGGRPSAGHRFWMRRALMKILTDFVDTSGAELHYGNPITDISLNGSGCTLHRGDQTTIVDDLIIGADGIDSVVRTCLEPNRIPVYAGDVVLYGMTTTPLDLSTDPAVLHFFAEIAPDNSSFSTLGHIWRPGDANALWFLRIAREPLTDGDDLGLRPVDEWADAVLEATPSNQELAQTFIEHTEVVHVSNARNVPLDNATESTEPALLIGDADHAITPAAGVGARDALEDVLAVYQALASNESPSAAMAQRRKQITAEREQVQRAMRRN